ncbi:MAG: hypothetical protein VX777_02900 [Chlamydiota bacterium]|nr:hypothetical protein [Chlamydiota bacterium]
MEDVNKEVEGLPLKDEIITAILMHREVHFGGSFNLMLEYYEGGGKGVSPDFTLENIVDLFQIEKKLEQNLAALILSGPDAEIVQKARESYKKLREVYQSESHADRYAQMIADLIFSEEEEPKKEIDVIVAEGKAIVPALIHISQSEDLQNPLYPGYGCAPHLATLCLGKIGDDRAVMALFEQIGRGNVQEEEEALSALRAVGEAAKEFLLKVVRSKPITEDNERAAIAIIQFKDDPVVGDVCLELLQNEEIRQTLPLAAYLVLACEGLQKEEQRLLFKKLSRDPKTPTILHVDFDVVMSSWKG